MQLRAGTVFSRPFASLCADRQFQRFLAVGALNTIVGYGMLWIALSLAPTTMIALCVSTTLAVLFNFLTNRTLVFEAPGSRPPLLMRLLRFFGVYGLVFVYNATGLVTLEHVGVDPRLGALLLLPGAVLLSYFLNRRFVFGATR